MSKKRVLLSDIARQAGVSLATVSVVVNNQVGNSIRVNPETEKRVWKAIRELGYVANPLARRLAGGVNKIIGLFTFEPIFPIKNHNFYYPFLVGIEEEVEHQGYDLLLFTSAGNSSALRSVFKDRINRLKVADGSILIGLHENEDELKFLLDEEYPFVYIGRRDLDHGKISYVAANYKKSTTQLVKYISEFGHKNIVYLHSNSEEQAHIDRYKGYLIGLQSENITYSEEFDWTGYPSDISEKLILKWIKTGVTAFVAENNVIAERFYLIANKLNKIPPRDYSIAILGDPIETPKIDIDWTMFRIPRQKMGEHAVKTLVKMLTETSQPKTPYQETLDCSSIMGSTVGINPNEH